jgi:hypothetical protein
MAGEFKGFSVDALQPAVAVQCCRIRPESIVSKCMQVGDHIQFRYEIQGCLGRGSFGQVNVPCCPALYNRSRPSVS